MEIQETIKRAVIYARTSSVDGLSIAEQIDTACHYCLNCNLGVIGTFVDCGSSGAKNDRPKFREMLENINTGFVNCVLVADADRLTRDTMSLHLFKQLMKDKGIELVFTACLPYTEKELAQKLAFEQCLKNMNTSSARAEDKAFPLKHY